MRVKGEAHRDISTWGADPSTYLFHFTKPKRVTAARLKRISRQHFSASFGASPTLLRCKATPISAMRLPSRPRFYTGCRPLTLRPRTRLGLAIRLALLALALYLLSYSCQQLGRLDLSTDLTWFDLGWYGFMPTRSYRSTRLTSPDLEFLARDARCSRDFYVFAPRGPAVGEKGGVILDHAGELVWRQAGFDGDTQDLRVQEYRGEKFLTFWVGTERDSQKKGVWYMVSIAI